jgi:hypothetical protein
MGPVASPRGRLLGSWGGPPSRKILRVLRAAHRLPDHPVFTVYDIKQVQVPNV